MSGNNIGYGSKKVDVAKKSVDLSETKVFTYLPNGDFDTITITKANGDVYIKTFTYKEDGSFNDIKLVKQ